MAKNPDLTEEQRNYIGNKVTEIMRSHGMRMERMAERTENFRNVLLCVDNNCEYCNRWTSCITYSSFRFGREETKMIHSK